MPAAQNDHISETPSLASPALTSARATLTTPEAARYLGIAASTLARLRMTGGGPDYVKLSDTAKGRVLYQRTALDDFLARRTRKLAG